MSFKSKSILARLLSKENISVQRGNFPTAFFDVENRVLGIPNWKDMGKDVYDLLIGHEVGHALFTPAEGWHDSATDIPGIPRSYVNVVEDVRIEKLIQRQYPGLVSSFKRGYGVLNDMDFFGVDGRDADALSLVDRINLKAKLRDQIDVSYSPEEQAVVDVVMSVETWDDVIEACKVLYAFMKDNQEEKQPNPTPDEEAASPSPSDMPAQAAEESDDDVKESESGDTTTSPESVDEEEADDEEEVMESETDESFRSNESKLIDETVAGHCLGMSRAQLNECVVPLQEVLDARILRPYRSFYESRRNSENDATYTEFQEETKRTVSVMAKEFEMRKAAFRTLRAQTSRSGSIDTSRLHSYKFNDDIFSRVTTLADAKSHGLVMFIDYSASMCDTIRDVIKQVLNMAVFAKKVNIPFEVYGFTNPDSREGKYTLAHSGHINHLSCQIMHLLSSSMKKSSFESAMADMYNNVQSDYERLYGTPLIETFIASTMLIKDFQAKYKTQKTNVIFMTDGFGQTPSMFSSDYAHKEMTESSSTLRGGFTININGEPTFFKKNLRGLELNEQALNAIRAMPGVHLTGFFLTEDNSSFKSAIYSASNYYVTQESMRAYKKELNAKKFVAFSNSFGYDDYYIVDGRNIDTTNTAFDVSDRASKAMITKAFKKHTSSKKGNRVLATKLAQMIAA